MDHTGLPHADRDVVTVSPDAIDGGALIDAVRRDDAGAVVLFLGTVRDHSHAGAGVTGLEYEAYAGVVEAKIAEIVDEARRRWDVGTVAAVHRVGGLTVGEVSVGVAVSAAHRSEAFEAARYLIDELKARAPIWKKEHRADGSEWVGS